MSDAKFFYETDLKTKLEDRLPKFEQIVFHEKLGTQAERIERIERLAAEIAPLVGADVEKTKRAAHLAKADLLTEVVGEFPELQGLMGKYYALAQGEDASVAAASEEHYKPQGPADRVPTDPVSVAVALADKIDTLVGFWAIDEKPTGARTPMRCAARRSGVIQRSIRRRIDAPALSQSWKSQRRSSRVLELAVRRSECRNESLRNFAEPIFLAFFADRLKVQLREQGARHDLVDAVFALEGQDDLLMVVRRVEALGKFLDTDDGKNLLAGTKRASQHPAHRGEEGQAQLRRRARCRALQARRGKGAGQSDRSGEGGSRRSRGDGRFRRRHERDGKAASGGRCVLRQGQGQRRRRRRCARTG